MSKGSNTRRDWDNKRNVIGIERPSLRAAGSYGKTGSRFSLFSLSSSISRVSLVANVRRIVGETLKTDEESLSEFLRKKNVEGQRTESP